MNFATLKGLTIPEGVVTQIADASGRVLWSAGEPCTVTIVAFGMSPTGNANVTLNGQTYSAKGISISINQNVPTPIAEITVPSGTVMSCSALTTMGDSKGTILLNDTEVAKAASVGVPATYDYVVNGNIKVVLNDAYVIAANMEVSRVLITEQPITFTINGTEYSAYPSMTWNDWNNSEFNTSGKKVATVTDASGNSVSLDSLIVGGTAYEVGFAPAMLTVELIWQSGGNAWFDHSELGEEISDGTHEVSPGSILTCHVSSHIREVYYEINVNGENKESGYISSGYNKRTYEYTITKSITVTYRGNDSSQYIDITET